MARISCHTQFWKITTKVEGKISLKVLVFGSLNIDYVYSVEHFVRPGETIASSGRQIFGGGKGLNQAIAFAKCGMETWQAGTVGQDDSELLLDMLEAAGVQTRLIRKIDGPSGHTIIQNTPQGENNIILFGGANQMISREYVNQVFENFEKSDYLVLQNEISEMPYIMQKAHQIGMHIVLNPSPMNEKIFEMPLAYVEYLILNEIEAAAILNEQETDDGEGLLNQLVQKFLEMKIVLTLGSKGALYADKNQHCTQKALKVQAVDTTAAGDTFTGYFMGEIMCGKEPQEAMKTATVAAAIAVCKKGASVSIPGYEEVMHYMMSI